MADTIIPIEALDQAHDALDALVANSAGRLADNVWISMMNTVEGMEPEKQRQNLALLLTVAVQRLARIEASK